MSGVIDKPDAKPITDTSKQATDDPPPIQSEYAAIQQCDEMLTDRDIAEISLTIEANKCFHFARTHLRLTDIQINNAAGRVINPCSEIHLKALHIWAERTAGSDSIKEEKLMELLEKDQKIMVVIKAKLHMHSEQISFARKLNIISKNIMPLDFEKFAETHLKVNLIPIISALPPNYDGLLADSIGILKTWRNIKGYDGTLGALYSIVMGAIEDEDLGPATRHKLHEIYARRDRKQDPQACSNVLRRHHTELIENMSTEVIEDLYSEGLVSKLEYEYLNEMQHNLDKRRYIVMVISGRDTIDALQTLQRALRRANQEELADLLNSTSTDAGGSGNFDTVDSRA